MADRFEIIIDTQEQKPFSFPQHKSKRVKLATGDYSIAGMEDLVSVERKTVPELWGLLGNEKARFRRELVRMQSMPWHKIVIEGTMAEALCGHRFSKMPGARIVRESIFWDAVCFVPVLWCDDRATAQAWTLRYLETIWKWRDILRESWDKKESAMEFVIRLIEEGEFD